MAIGYWVAPTPEMSTRSCAWAAPAASRLKASSSPNRPARHERCMVLITGMTVVMSAGLLFVIHLVIHVGVRAILARRWIGEWVAGPDPGVDGSIECGVAG